MDEPQTHYFFKVGHHVLTSNLGIQQMYGEGERFALYGLTWLCKNTEETPANHVVAVLDALPSPTSIKRLEKIRRTYEALKERKWSELKRSEARMLISQYFPTPRPVLVLEGEAALA
ncbi:MAG: hypothetical protein ACOYMZ_02470 [Minisyncoccia bacterium]